MLKTLSPRLRAVLLALLVTFLWSTSWVLVKIGLKDIPALPFAGLRYTLAFVALLPFALRGGRLRALRHVSAGGWLRLAALGLLYYAITQGTQFVALDHLPAVTLSLMLNFSAVIVAALGIVTLGEWPTLRQWGGVALFMAGVLIYFGPVAFPREQMFGLIIGAISVLATSISSVLGRYVNRAGDLDAMTVTVVTMGIGSLALLGAGVIAQGLPRLSLPAWGIVVWLAVVNTALAFTLWNHTLRTLSAMELSIINNTMLIQIALLAWLFLGEQQTAVGVLGLALAAAGALIVQVRQREPAAAVEGA